MPEKLATPPDMDDGMPDGDDLSQPQASPEESGLTWGQLMNKFANLLIDSLSH